MKTKMKTENVMLSDRLNECSALREIRKSESTSGLLEYYIELNRYLTENRGRYCGCKKCLSPDGVCVSPSGDIWNFELCEHLRHSDELFRNFEMDVKMK
jgi:hypothetical protein